MRNSSLGGRVAVCEIHVLFVQRVIEPGACFLASSRHSSSEDAPLDFFPVEADAIATHAPPLAELNLKLRVPNMLPIQVFIS